jgi:translation elongation factor EF-1beta
MDQLVKNVLAIEMDGLVWGAHRLQAVGFGIKKMQVNFVVEDEKVSIDDLQGKIEEDEDHVQSTDIVAMQASIPFPERLDQALTICRNSKGSRHDLRMSVSHCVGFPDICCRCSALAISSSPSLIDDEHYDHKNAK